MRIILPRLWTLILALVVLALMARHAGGDPISIDGLPADWGIAPAGPFDSDWEPDPGIDGVWEDDAWTWSGYLGPGWGGQRYDAEGLYFTHDDAWAYFGLVTGFPPDGVDDDWAGDLALDIGRDGSWDLGIETTGDRDHLPGALYRDIAWASGLWPSSDPTEMLSATAAWTPPGGTLYYNYLGDDHYFLETGVPLSQLPLSPDQPTDFRAHWTMTCGNDAVDLDAQFPVTPNTPPSIIPEPATCTLLGSGLLAVFALRARKRRRSGEPREA
ncbi:MAG: hypothetical protein ACLF0G_11405 [Candidatus Brocadiia bacterium]